MWNKRKEEEPQPKPAATPAATSPMKESPVMSSAPAPAQHFPESRGPAVIGKSVMIKGQIFSREDLTIDGSGSSAQSNVTFGAAANCWMQNVKSLYGLRDHVVLWYAAHISVVDSYFYGLHAYGTTAYGMETDSSSTSLIASRYFLPCFGMRICPPRGSWSAVTIGRIEAGESPALSL